MVAVVDSIIAARVIMTEKYRQLKGNDLISCSKNSKKEPGSVFIDAENPADKCVFCWYWVHYALYFWKKISTGLSLSTGFFRGFSCC